MPRFRRGSGKSKHDNEKMASPVSTLCVLNVNRADAAADDGLHIRNTRMSAAIPTPNVVRLEPDGRLIALSDVARWSCWQTLLARSRYRDHRAGRRCESLEIAAAQKQSRLLSAHLQYSCCAWARSPSRVRGRRRGMVNGTTAAPQIADIARSYRWGRRGQESVRGPSSRANRFTAGCRGSKSPCRCT